jgi:hypothetical protein
VGGVGEWYNPLSWGSDTEETIEKRMVVDAKKLAAMRAARAGYTAQIKAAESENMSAIGTGSLLTDPFTKLTKHIPKKYRPLGAALPFLLGDHGGRPTGVAMTRAVRPAPQPAPQPDYDSDDGAGEIPGDDPRDAMVDEAREMVAMGLDDGTGSDPGWGAGDDDYDDGSQPYTDDGSQPYPDDGTQPQQPQQPNGPSGPGVASKIGSAIYTPIKYAAMPLVYGARIGGQLLKTGADVTKGVAKIATAPLKAISKIFSIFGVEGGEVPLCGLPAIHPAMLGAEDDPYYFKDDEHTQPYPETAEDVEDSPVSQQLRIHTMEIHPGVWQAEVQFPNGRGRMITAATSPAPSEEEAVERAQNLATAAGNTPELHATLTPQAKLALANMFAKSPGGRVSRAVQSANQFVRLEP